MHIVSAGIDIRSKLQNAIDNDKLLTELNRTSRKTVSRMMISSISNAIQVGRISREHSLKGRLLSVGRSLKSSLSLPIIANCLPLSTVQVVSNFLNVISFGKISAASGTANTGYQRLQAIAKSALALMVMPAKSEIKILDRQLAILSSLQKVKGADGFDYLACNHYQKTIEARVITKSRLQATVELFFSPIWIPLKTVQRVVTTIFDILSFGEFSVHSGIAINSLKGRVTAIAQSVAALVILPATVFVEGISCISHLVKPGAQKIDYLAVGMWTGGALGRVSCATGNEKFENYKEIAKNGNPETLFQLGTRYAKGFEGKKPDLKTAAKCYKRAAKLVHQAKPQQAIFAVMAMRDLGILYEKGWEGNPSDFKTAAEWYQKAYQVSISKNYAEGFESLYRLGRLYEKGWKGELPNPSKAFECYAIAVTHPNYLKDALADFCRLSKVGWKGRIVALKNATNEILAEAKTSDEVRGGAAYILGLMYEFGWKQQPPDIKKALYWYEREDELFNNCKARMYFRAGELYQLGWENHPPDIEYAAHLFRKAFRLDKRMDKVIWSYFRRLRTSDN